MYGEKEGNEKDFKEISLKDSDESRIECWESRKACERTVENKVYLAGEGSRIH
jgi:hypothetical protein